MDYKDQVAAVVQTAEGEIKQFAGVTARFIVAHPRVAATIAFLAGLGLGALLF